MKQCPVTPLIRRSIGEEDTTLIPSIVRLPNRREINGGLSKLPQMIQQTDATDEGIRCGKYTIIPGEHCSVLQQMEFEMKFDINKN